ncbi:Uncharacterized protein Fot_25477 [Forsythia ovata]|uniref:Uncharacterized protein n=1 Tax=Forsythia ovata TaxID=205694 RepID=A0ABD1U969_9LAMI
MGIFAELAPVTAFVSSGSVPVRDFVNRVRQLPTRSCSSALVDWFTGYQFVSAVLSALQDSAASGSMSPKMHLLRERAAIHGSISPFTSNLQSIMPGIQLLTPPPPPPLLPMHEEELNSSNDEDYLSDL